MRSGSACAIFLVFLISTTWATDDPKAFFQKFIELGHTYNPEVAALYSDEARIRAYRLYPHGTERTMEMNGAQWKQLVTATLPLAKARRDKSTFSNVTITKEGIGFRIKADRYSELKCYTDTGYYLIVNPREDGRLEIVEEYLETQPQSNC